MTVEKSMHLRIDMLARSSAGGSLITAANNLRHADTKEYVMAPGGIIEEGEEDQSPALANDRSVALNEMTSHHNLKRQAFMAKMGILFEPTCNNGHNLKRFERRGGGDYSKSNIVCDSCSEPISKDEMYLKCEKKACKTKYCQRCVGCPKGHKVAMFRLVEPLI